MRHRQTFFVSHFKMLLVSYLKDFVVTFINVCRVQVTPVLQTNKTKNNSKTSKSKKSRYGCFIFLYDANVKMRNWVQKRCKYLIFLLSIKILILTLKFLKTSSANQSTCKCHKNVIKKKYNKS